MKKLITFLCILVLLLICKLISSFPTVKIINKVYNNEGAVTVTFTYGSDTLTYHDLTSQEYAQFIATGRPFSK